MKQSPRFVSGGAAAVALFVLSLPAPAAALEVHMRGLLDLVGTGTYNEAIDFNYYNAGDSNFDPWRLKLFAESEIDGGFAAHTQFAFSEAAGVEVFGAYIVWTPDATRDLHLTAGKIPWPIGTWAARSYSNKNPLVGLPLMYQYHTSLRVDMMPPDADALLGAAGQGQTRPDYGTGQGWRGMPIVYDKCWDFGAFFSGTMRPFEFAFGATNGTPGVSVSGQDWNGGKTILGRVGIAPTPALRIGVSGAHGPHLPNWLASTLPPGKEIEDYNTDLIMGDAEFSIGHVDVHGEAFHNTWETPTVGNLEVRGGYLETKLGLGSAWFAGRYEILRFGDLTGSAGTRPWDNDVDRLETGFGYRVTREAQVKAVYQRNVMQIPGADDRVADLVAAQLSLAF